MSQSEIKKNRTQAVIQKMKEHRYDPLDALINVAKDDRVPLDVRIDCHKTLIKYVYPTLKHVEIDAQVKQDLIVQVKQFVKPEKVVPIGEKHDKQLTGQGIPIGGQIIEARVAGAINGHPDILAD